MKEPAGFNTRFKPGHITWNKGMKGLDIGGKETRFKPGQMPHNTHAIGSYRITRDGYLQRKIGNAKGSNSKRWRGVHELVKVIPPMDDWSDVEQWHLRRFGLSDDKTTPIKDGHQDIHYISGLKQVAPDVWKDEWDCETPRWMCCPLYYRRMTFSGHQESLF